MNSTLLFSSLLDELSVWLDTSTFDDFNDVMTALTDIADSADATGSDIDTINFTIGVDACKLFCDQKIINDI